MGLQLGWFRGGKLPIGGLALKGSVGSLASKADGPAAQGSSQDKRADNLRATCANMLHLCVVLLSDPRWRRVCQIMCVIGEPFRKAHRITEKMLTTPENVMHYYSQLALGKYTHSFSHVLDRFRDPECMRSLGVGLFASASAPQQKRAEISPQLEAAIADEKDLVGDAWNYALVLVKGRSQSLSHHSHSVPGVFALLVSGQVADRARGLRLAKEVWVALCEAERLATSYADVRILLCGVPWAAWLFPREVLVSLAQWGFGFVPKPTADALLTLFGGWGHSLTNENGFNMLKDGYRESKGMVLSRERRFFTPVVKKLLSERYGRSEIGIRNEDDIREAPGLSLPSSCYESQGAPPSVPAEKLKRILGRSIWSTFSPQSSHLVVSASQLLLDLQRSGKWQKVNTVWHSILVREGKLLHHTRPSSFLLVLSSD